MSQNSNNSNEKSNDSKSSLIIISTVAVIAILSVIGFYNVQFSGELSNKHDQWAQFGDYFGGTLNPILSFLSLIAILLTLRYQIKELNASTKELKNSSTALKDQSESLKLQAFENTFFQMLRLHNDLVSDMDILQRNTQQAIHTGRDCFGYFVKKLDGQLSIRINQNDGEDRAMDIRHSYSEFQKKYGSDTDHYFRNLFTIVKYIEQYSTRTLENDSQKYADIVGAQLSTNELTVLFYNCLQPDYHKFKGYVEQYCLLENMNVKALKVPEQEIVLYEKSAYGNNVEAQTYFDKLEES